MRINLKRFNYSFLKLVFTLGFFSFNFAHASTPPRFSAGLMATLGQGPMGNEADVPNRSMLFTSASVFLGLNYKKLRLGAHYENYRAGQSADNPEIAGQNISGTGNVPGARLDYYDGRQAFGFIYRFGDIYALSRPTIQGTPVTYKARSGYSVQYYRQYKKNFGFVIDYTSEEFDESLTLKVKWNRVGIGMVFTNFSK